MTLLDPLIWLINGVLVIVYVLVDHLPLVACLPGLAWMVVSSPVEQRTWAFVVGSIVLSATALVPPPVPLILLAMICVGLFAVWLDRFGPSALRWRVMGGLALYSLTALGFTAYAAYVSRLDPDIWAGVLAQGEAASVVSQGRAFLTTIAVWGLWIILPLGYLGMLVQGMLVHPPLKAAPSDLLFAIRSRQVSPPGTRGNDGFDL